MGFADSEDRSAGNVDSTQAPGGARRIAGRPLAALLAAAPLLAAGCGSGPGGASGTSGEPTSEDATSEDTTGGSTDVAPTSSGTTELPAVTGTSTTTGDDSTTSDGNTGDEPPPAASAIGLVQYDADSHFGDYEYNLASLTMWAEAAVEQGAKLIVFPEGSTYGYASESEVWCAPGMDQFADKTCVDVSTVAEPLPGGPTTSYWEAFAAEHGVAVIYHVPERDGEAFYNALGVVGPDGYVARYRKRSLYYIDTAYASPGDSGTLLDTPWGRFGLMICLDGTYDGGYYDEYLADNVDGIILAMDWDDDPEGMYAARTWFQGRAAANNVRIYAADVSTWDGTGLYLPGDVPRVRNGLAPIAVGVDGVSVHAFDE